jgi:hypothetical protein
MEDDMTTTNSKIVISLVEAGCLTRWPCHVCGGYTEKVSVLAEGEHHRVCESCLQAGDIDARLERFAARLEAQAKDTRGLIGRLQVPTYEAWQAACDRYEAEAEGMLAAARANPRPESDNEWPFD